jgi:hypothetical protein
MFIFSIFSAQNQLSANGVYPRPLICIIKQKISPVETLTLTCIMTIPLPLTKIWPISSRKSLYFPLHHQGLLCVWSENGLRRMFGTYNKFPDRGTRDIFRTYRYCTSYRHSRFRGQGDLSSFPKFAPFHTVLYAGKERKI